MPEMPRYHCHKVVRALKIHSVEPDPSSEAVAERARLLTFEDPGFSPLRVEEDYVRRHNPQPGGYYVVYEPDGYASFSPAGPFEAGYSRMDT
jgi:hypothetical protein